MSDFIALDVETANADFASICAIGLVHFRDGKVLRDLSTLINPEDDFDPVNMAVHNITPEAVHKAPTMRELYPIFHRNFGVGVTVVHHTHFDRSAFQKVAEKLQMPPLECRWLDSSRVVRRAWPQYSQKGYGLANVCYDFNIEFEHHNAAEDARAAGLLVCRAIGEHGISLDEWCARASNSLATIAAAQSPKDPNPDGLLYGNTIVFTGTLSMPRSVAQKMALDAGCILATTPSKKTTLVVVGQQDIRQLKGQLKSTKHRAAEELIQAGYPLRIVGEEDFRRLVSNRL